jgi:lipopolysaccharide export system permease protein
MKINTIHRVILKELLFTFILSVISLNFILIMEKILKLSRLLSVVGASVFDLTKIIIYLQFPILILTIPMSLLVSTLVTYGRLNADNELVILKSSGMTFGNISKPVFIAGLSCFFASLLISFYMGPMSMVKLRNTVSDVLRLRAPSAIDEGVFTTLFKDVVLFVREKTDKNTLKDIFIYDERNKKDPRVLVAKEGFITVTEEFAVSFYLKDGFMHMAKDTNSTEIFFSGYNLVLNFAADQLSKKNSEFTPLELITEAKKVSSPENVPLYLELHRRISLPFVCLVLMLLGPPLSLLAGKSGKLGGLTTGLLVFVVFYILLIYGENLARAGSVPHYVGAWAPAVIIGIFSLIIFRRESRR